jgi:hypothetical protein
MLASIGLRLKQGCQYVTTALLVKKQFFEKELIKTKEIAINAEA